MAIAIFGRVRTNCVCREYFRLHMTAKEPACTAPKGGGHGLQERLGNDQVEGLWLRREWGRQNTAVEAAR